MEYRAGALHLEDVRLDDLARRIGTPCYVYSSAAIIERFRAYDDAFHGAPRLVCYAVKANSNLSILRLLAEAGAGFDIVSGGELYRVLKAGGEARKTVFSGVGKTAAEIEYALDRDIRGFNCESEPELALIDSLAARRGVRASVALRVNPDVDASTHPYVSTGLREHKFGVDIAQADGVYGRARSLAHLDLHAVSCHIGSQMLDTAPMLAAIDKVVQLAQRLRAQGIPIRALDFGGGLGVAYRPGDTAPSIPAFVASIREKTRGLDLEIVLEPGRSIVAQAGALLTRVLYRKQNGAAKFVVVDAGMNDLLRPALYQSHHEILPLREPPSGAASTGIVADIVGPVCETGDFLARNRPIANVLPGDLLAVLDAGAYGFVSASNYNARPRPAEALVEGSAYRVIRRRETYEDLVRGE